MWEKRFRVSCQTPPNASVRLYQSLIGPEENKTLILSTDENWLPTKTQELADSVTIACKEGFVDVSEMR